MAQFTLYLVFVVRFSYLELGTKPQYFIDIDWNVSVEPSIRQKLALFLFHHQNFSPQKAKVEAMKMTIKQSELPKRAWAQFKSNRFWHNKAQRPNANLTLMTVYNSFSIKEHTLNQSSFWAQSIILSAFHIPTSKILTPTNRKLFQYWSLFPAMSHNPFLYKSSVFQWLCNCGTVKSSPQRCRTQDSIISKTRLPVGVLSQRVRTETFLCIWHSCFKSQIFSSI